jgi:hypothetical protein
VAVAKGLAVVVAGIFIDGLMSVVAIRLSLQLA